MSFLHLVMNENVKAFYLDAKYDKHQRIVFNFIPFQFIVLLLDHMLHTLPRFSFVLMQIKIEKDACTIKFQLPKDYSNAAYLALLS